MAIDAHSTPAPAVQPGLLRTWAGAGAVPHLPPHRLRLIRPPRHHAGRPCRRPQAHGRAIELGVKAPRYAVQLRHALSWRGTAPALIATARDVMPSLPRCRRQWPASSKRACSRSKSTAPAR